MHRSKRVKLFDRIRAITPTIAGGEPIQFKIVQSPFVLGSTSPGQDTTSVEAFFPVSGMRIDKAAKATNDWMQPTESEGCGIGQVSRKKCPGVSQLEIRPGVFKNMSAESQPNPADNPYYNPNR